MKYTLLPISRVLFSLLLFCACCNNLSYGAHLDDLYQPLLKKGRILYDGEVDYFLLQEKGVHGNDLLNDFDSQPYFCAFANTLQFSPADSLEVGLGFNQVFPANYRRFTYTNSGALTSLQKYDIDYFRDYALHLRARKELLEVYLDILDTRQKTAWSYAAHPAPANYFSYIRAHLEDFKTGLRYLSGNGDSQEKSNLSKLTYALLSDKQINAELELGYRGGKVRRLTEYYHSSGLYHYNFFHAVRPHFIPQLNLRWGLRNNVLLATGFAYTTPWKYKDEFKQFNPNSTSFLVTGTYKLEDSVSVPLSLYYRPRDNLEITLSSDYSSATQRLDYWQKNTDGTLINYPSKTLTFHRTTPTIKATYLFDGGKAIEEDEFSELTKDLLRKHQWLLEFQYKKDITHLDKNADNGPQNIIDPYNVFLYPLDFFVGGSEYAALLTGNTTNLAANVQPQNYYLGQLAFRYGFTDAFNGGFRVGYHSGSALHHFTIGNSSSYDVRSRFYKFKPYYFFDTVCDWRLTKNSILSFYSHFVPEYTTLLKISGYTKEFKSEDEYLGVSCNLKILF